MPFPPRCPWYRALILGLLLNLQGAIAWSASTVPTSLHSFSTQDDLGRHVGLPLRTHPPIHPLPIHPLPISPSPHPPIFSTPTLLSLVRYRRPPARRPRWGAPRWSYGGAARGLGCQGAGDSPVVPLVPVDGVDTQGTDPHREAAFLGLTAAAFPTLLVYVPETTAQAIDVLVTNEQRGNGDPTGQVIYQHQIPLNQGPGIVRFDLSAPASITTAQVPLEPDRPYTWSISLLCQASDIGGPSVAGLMERVSPDLAPDPMAAGSDPLAQVEAYAEAGLWYETLAGLADLYCKNPDDPDIQADWFSLLLSLELTNVPALVRMVQSQKLAAAPLLWCGEPTP